MNEPARLAHNFQHYAAEVADIIDNVIGSRGEADDSQECFEAALIQLRYLRQDLHEKATEVLASAARSEAAE